MPAWQVARLGEPEDAFERAEIAVPEPRPGQVLVKVSWAGLNFPDVLMARGGYQVRPPLPFTPGIELCGEIVAVGPGGDDLRIGERVMGTPMLPYGSLAGYALANDAEVVPAPVRLDDDEAAAFHVTYQTAWFGLYRRASLRVGETLVVYAAAGGAGSAAVQLGKAAGARVIGVVGSPDKVRVLDKLGADVALDRSSVDVVAAVKDLTDGRGADVVYDPVGGPAFRAATKMVAFEGRVVVVGFTSGELAEAPTNHLLVKNYSLLGLHWGLYLQKDPELVARARLDLERLVDAGACRPFLSERLSFDEVPQALTRLAAGQTVGRLVVRIPPD